MLLDMAQTGCPICAGTLNPCPICFTYASPKMSHPSWEQRLESRRGMGSHETVYQADIEPAPAAYGIYSIDNGGDRVGPKYSREFNSKIDGPGKGTW
jgi:hypothetical protein